MLVFERAPAIGVVGVAAVVIALILTNPSLRAAPASRGEGQIVFGFGESGSDHPAQLALMDGDGGNRRLLPLDHVYSLSWSPDGRFVAYQGVEPRASSYKLNIWTMSIDGRPRFRRVVRNGASPDWSPNGNAIAFERGRVYPCTRGCDIWVIGLNDRRQRRIVRDGHSPRWSPDGRQLVFERGSIRTDLWVFDLAAKKARRLVRNAESADWSPDGREIVFQRCRMAALGEDCSIYVIRANGTAQRRLFEGQEPFWSPGGREIAFIGEDARHHRLDAIIRTRLDGSGRRSLFGQSSYCGCFLLAWGNRRRR